MTALYEQHRPTTLDGIIGQPKAVKTIKRLLQNGAGGHCFWISGASGTGKTTLARIIAGTIADYLYVNEYDCADMLTVAAIDKIEQDMSYYAGGKGGRCFIVNESHGLRRQSIRKLLGLLERIPAHVCIIFTTTREGEADLFGDQIDSLPLISRCIRIPLTNQGLCKTFAEHCHRVATQAGLNGKSLQSYEKLLAKCKNNMRMALNEIESGVML